MNMIYQDWRMKGGAKYLTMIARLLMIAVSVLGVLVTTYFLIFASKINVAGTILLLVGLCISVFILAGVVSIFRNEFSNLISEIAVGVDYIEIRPYSGDVYRYDNASFVDIRDQKAPYPWFSRAFSFSAQSDGTQTILEIENDRWLFSDDIRRDPKMLNELANCLGK